ncbi:MAG: MgtC/SapB family protein [Planctomycetales bacterium]|nr:MgtC/SapB family protein [Planctomycetales bacterium]
MDAAAYQSVALSLGLGLLVGLQRQWSKSDIAGIRTFPLITLLGTMCGLLSDGSPGWLAAAALVTVAVLLAVANFAKMKSGESDFGLTTEAAALLMCLVGVALGTGVRGPAIVVSGIVAVLLQWKDRLHGFVGRMGEEDIRSVIRLALIGLVILPVLPNKAYGPYNVLNPYEIWRMVVLIVGISMAAYVVHKLVGPGVGAVVGGVLGGLISSTATTVSYARQTKSTPRANAAAALVIVIASTIVNVRVLFEIGVVSPQLFRSAALPIGAMLLLMLVECVVFMIPMRNSAADGTRHDDPTQLTAAIVFGVLYAAILFVVAAAKDLFGDGALYGIAAVSGLTDVDAITLSTAKLFNDGRVEADAAWRVILLATLSNLVFKTGAVAVLGSRKLLTYVTVLLGFALIGGATLLWLWPDPGLALPGEWFPREIVNG